MKPLLSILIPTYKRIERLKKTFPKLIEEISNEIEFIVIDNASEDGTESFINDFINKDKRVRYFKNPVNIGPNRNIYRGFLESEGDWFTIIPDDDFVENSFLRELLLTIKTNQNCGLIIPYLENNSKVFEKTTIIKKGIKALTFSYKNSSAITGLTFKKNAILEKEWFLDGFIYPQVKLAVDLSLMNDVVWFVSKKPPKVGEWGDKYSSLERPSDFGIFEQLAILIEVLKKTKKSERTNLRHSLSAGLFSWAITTGTGMYLENKSNTLLFFKVLLENKFINSSCIFLGLLFYKVVLNKQILFLHRIKILGYVSGSILKALFQSNFYSSLFYSLKEIKKIKQKTV